MPEEPHSNDDVMTAFTWLFNHSEAPFGACRIFASSGPCKMTRWVQVLASLFVLLGSDQRQWANGNQRKARLKRTKVTWGWHAHFIYTLINLEAFEAADNKQE